MKRSVKIIISAVLALAFVGGSFGCKKGGDGGSAMIGGGYGLTKDGAAGLGEGAEYGAEKKSAKGDENAEQNGAGLITACAWDDNRYYEYFLSLFEKSEVSETSEDEEDSGETDEGEENSEVATENEDGRFYHYLENDRWGLYANERVKVEVTCKGRPVAGATVAYKKKAEGDDTFQNARFAVTDANGIAYLFPDYAEGDVLVESGEYEAISSFSAQERNIEVALDGAAAKDELIKLMFVVDVTGSMGDELNYLTKELKDVIERVAGLYANIKIDLAFLFYRDDGDKEKFNYCDFLRVTESNNLETQREKLKKERASGGGDYPEALDEALEIAIGKNWGDENSTKLIFHIFDAPAHDNANNKARFSGAVKLAAKKGIRINPVLCSGADTLCEYLAREEAIHTQGHFCFITDDSGIGNSHYDPNIPNAVVEKLNDLMVRLISGYYSGTFAEPVAWNANEGN